MQIIEELKKNEKPFGLMSKEMQDKAVEIGKRENFDTYRGRDKGWVKIHEDGSDIFNPEYTYRLRPYYKEEPEVVKCEVFLNSIDELKYKLNFCDNTDIGEYLDIAVRKPDFIGFLYKDGTVTTQARMYKRANSSGLAYDIQDLENYEVLTPTHVLFRSAK